MRTWVPLTVAAGTVGSTLTGFPVRVDLSEAPAAWWDACATDGSDIRVRAAGVHCPVDLVTINHGAQTGWLYFRNTLTTADNHFTLECGTGAAALDVDDPRGRHAVWADYEVMLDFYSLANRTGKTDDAVLEGAASISGGRLDCASSTGHARVDDVALFTSWTMGAQATRTGGASSNMAVLSYTQPITGNTSRASLLWRASTSWQVWNSTDTFLSSGDSSSSVRIHHTQNTTTDRKVWVNGVLAGTDTSCAQRPAGAGESFYVGAEDESIAERLWGSVARAYLRTGVLSADWLAAEYESWESPSTFYTMGSEVSTSNAVDTTVLLDDGSGDFPFDISAYVEWGADGGPLQIVRGRADELSTVQPSTLSLTLNNTDGRFTFGSTSGGYGAIDVDRPIRVIVTAGAVTSYRFTGYVQEWPVAWPGGGEDYALARITATDRFARMARRTLRCVIEEEILADEPLFLYPLSEPRDVTSVGSLVPGADPLQRPLDLFGNHPPITRLGVDWFDSLTALECSSQELRNSQRWFTTPPTVAWMEATFSSGALDQDVYFGRFDTGDGSFFATPSGALWLFVDSATGFLSARFIGNGVDTTAASAVSVLDGEKHHALVEVESGVGATLYLDGVAVDVAAAPTFTTGTWTNMALIVGDYELGTTGEPTMSHLALGTTALGAVRALSHAQAALTGLFGEAPEDRLTRLAGYSGVTPSEVDAETGATRDLAADYGLAGLSPLAAIQRAESGEGGLTFVSGGGDLVMQNRHHRGSQGAAAWTLDAYDLSPESAVAADMQKVVNHVTASRPEGAKQVAKDDASILAHEQYPASMELPLTTDAEVKAAADWLVATHAEPALRLPSARVDILSQPTAFQEAWLELELSGRVTVTGMPSQSGDLDLITEGWTEVLAQNEWSANLNTSPFAQVSALTLDDATLGQLDSNRLVY